MEDQSRFAVQIHAKYLVVLEESTFFSGNYVRVTDLDQRRSESVFRRNLVQYLKELMSESNNNDYDNCLEGIPFEQVNVNWVQAPRQGQQIRASYFKKLGINSPHEMFK